MEFLDMVYGWIVAYTVFDKDMGFFGFLIFIVPFFMGLQLVIMCFNYPLFPKNTTLEEAFEATSKSNNRLGHKSLLMDLFVGLGLLGVSVPYFIPVTLLMAAFIFTFGTYVILRDFVKRLFR